MRQKLTSHSAGTVLNINDYGYDGLKWPKTGKHWKESAVPQLSIDLPIYQGPDVDLSASIKRNWIQKDHPVGKENLSDMVNCQISSTQQWKVVSYSKYERTVVGSVCQELCQESTHKKYPEKKLSNWTSGTCRAPIPKQEELYCYFLNPPKRGQHLWLVRCFRLRT